MEWISADDRLPKLGVPVVVYSPASSIKMTMGRLSRRGNGMVLGYMNVNIFPKKGEITHWMPLPEPPELT
jgi:hypothetical protein